MYIKPPTFDKLKAKHCSKMQHLPNLSLWMVIHGLLEILQCDHLPLLYETDQFNSCITFDFLSQAAHVSDITWKIQFDKHWKLMLRDTASYLDILFAQKLCTGQKCFWEIFPF